MKTFLTAEWKYLTIFNYRVPDEVLTLFLPDGCTLDKYEGSSYVSLVAFQFTNTRVLGVKWPGFTNFPEINLRFYIKYGGRRGVCFIKEYVPSRLVAAIARSLYNEPYKSAHMTDKVTCTPEVETLAEYTLTDRAGHLYISVTAQGEPKLPHEDSLEHFFKEHELGVGRDKKYNTMTYEVSHPHWRIFDIKKAEARLNWKTLYGPQFEFLEGQEPDSVCFAEGSEIKVFAKNQG